MKEEETERSRVLWQDEDGLGAARGHFSHRSPQQLCSPRLLTLRAARSCSGQDGATWRAAAGGVQRLAVKPPPLENKASGSCD